MTVVRLERWAVFLGDGNAHLVVADLGLRSLPLNRDAVDGDLFVAGGYIHALAVGAYGFAHSDLSGLTLAGSGPELLLGTLHPTSPSPGTRASSRTSEKTPSTHSGE